MAHSHCSILHYLPLLSWESFYRNSSLLKLHIRIGHERVLLDKHKAEVKQCPLLSKECQSKYHDGCLRKCQVPSSLFLLFFTLHLIILLNAVLLTNSGLRLTSRCLVLDAHGKRPPHSLPLQWLDVLDFSKFTMTSSLILKISVRPSIPYLFLPLCNF